jgi:hypothetical protein
MVEEGGLAPDHRTFAHVMQAYEALGNRHMMLQLLSEMQDMEVAGELAEPLRVDDSSLPYEVLATSYAKVGDAPRAISILKYCKDQGSPVTREMQKVRLEAHLRTPRGPRRMPEEIERAFRDVIAARPEKGPVYTEKFDRMCRGAMGYNTYKAILTELGVDEEQLVDKLPAADAVNWRKALIQEAVKKRSGGISALFKKREGRYLAWRRYIANQEVMGQTSMGYRVAGPNGVPQWMELKTPVIYGGGESGIVLSSQSKFDRIASWLVAWRTPEQVKELIAERLRLKNRRNKRMAYKVGDTIRDGKLTMAKR